ncbi:MAG: signal peptidase I [Clostridiales bacterium]|nr:signal peptidase I [Clostridiales bacterium]
MRKAVRIITEIITWLLIAVLALFLVYSVYCRIKGESVRLFGIQADVVQSGSMEPTLYKYDLVFAKKVTEDEIQTGDILVFKRDGTKYVHRLISCDNGVYVTQGDANNISDEPITYADIEGKVVKTWAKVGVAVQFFQSIYGIILIVAVILAVVCFKRLVGILRKDKGANGSSKRNNHEET